MKSFEELVAEAESRRFQGWDFAYLEGRLVEERTPWDYRAIISELLSGMGSLVDLGTGGGEPLSSLRPLPRMTCATEGYRPNVQVANRRLRPLGIEVVETYCDDNIMTPQRGALPFRGGSVDLVTCRHESFIAAEIFRVLRPSGRFVTQQVGANNYPELNAALGLEAHPAQGGWGLREAVSQHEDAGLEVTDSREARLEARFMDVGAVVYYLKAVPWQVPDFTARDYSGRLRELDRTIRKNGPLRATFPRFLLQAKKAAKRS